MYKFNFKELKPVKLEAAVFLQSVNFEVRGPKMSSAQALGHLNSSATFGNDLCSLENNSRCKAEYLWARSFTP